MRTLARYFRPARWRLAAMAALGVAQTIVLLPIPLLLRYAFDRGIPERNASAIVWAGVAMMALQGLSAWIAVRVRAITIRIVKRTARDLRAELLARWLDLPRRRYAAVEPAVMHDRIVHDVERVDGLINAVFALVVPAAILIVGITAILFWLSPLLTITTITLVPLASFVSHRLRRRLRTQTRAFMATFERMNRGVWGALEATDLTKIEAASRRQLALHGRAIDDLERDGYQLARVQSAVTNSHAALTMVIGGAILIIGGVLLSAGALSLGDLLSFYGALALLRSSGNMALAALPQIVEGRAAAERIDETMEDRPVPEYTGTRPHELRGRVELDQVTFGYGPMPVFSNLTFAIEPGEVIGISGDSGAGKTTLVMLALGLYRPASGRVLFDGVPLDDLDVDAVRRQIGMMPQDPLILADTVYNNIAFGLSPDAVEVEAQARVAHASTLADADGFVSDLPDRYQTVLGPRGINLSGGQRQRIALARALAKYPRLLILDEPTNHLGTPTVTRLLDALARWPEPPAVLVISHDQELLARLPRVLHLSGGALHEMPRTGPGVVLGGRFGQHRTR